jgi:RNA polymerase sigma-70 factor (ECF subfamily)
MDDVADSSRDPSFNAVVLPHLAAAAHRARWLAYDANAAEDLLQDALVRALTYFSSYRGINARRWLLRIVRNSAYTSTSRNRGIELVPLETKGTMGAIVNMTAPGDDPETNLIKARDVRRVRRAIAALPGDLRETLVLREFEAFSYKEIAAATGTPIGTVMSRLWRARQTLLRVLDEPSTGAPPLSAER